jgi:DNA-binding protein HU-beta
MNKSELIAAVAKKAEVTQAVAEKVLNAKFEVVGEALRGGEETVQITNFGTYKATFQEGREGVNPLKKGETIKIPSSYRIYFSAGAGLKAAVNTVVKKKKAEPKKEEPKKVEKKKAKK